MNGFVVGFLVGLLLYAIGAGALDLIAFHRARTSDRRWAQRKRGV